LQRFSSDPAIGRCRKRQFGVLGCVQETSASNDLDREGQAVAFANTYDEVDGHGISQEG
jgi:hypothetical protein